MLVATFPADLGWIAERIYENDVATGQSKLTDMIYTRLQTAFSSWWTNNIPEPPPTGVTTAIPRPTTVYCTPWSTDPYAQGAYSYIATGGTGSDVDTVASPMGRIYFAGEHTDRQYIATMAAAFRSGYIAVNGILTENQKPTLTIPAPPPVPVSISATAGPGSATVSFTGYNEATSYTVISNPKTTNVSGTSSPILVTGLTPGTVYTFKVFSNNSAGGSSNSVSSNTVTVL